MKSTVLLALALVSTEAGGQRAAQPVVAEPCHGVFQSTVSSGRTHPRFDECASVMHVEIARYLSTEAPRTNEPAVFAREITAASPFRDPAIFDAALELAGDRGAPVNVQLLGWFML